MPFAQGTIDAQSTSIDHGETCKQASIEQKTATDMRHVLSQSLNTHYRYEGSPADPTIGNCDTFGLLP